MHFGLLAVDKPLDCTSHDVVQFIRWGLGQKSVGHTGTLDPQASGMLVVLVGGATRLCDFLAEDDKEYRARFVLGRATTSADSQGQTVAEGPWSGKDVQRALHLLSAMVGPLLLRPPGVSAIKVRGRSAHVRLRAGESVELAPRPMVVREVEILGHDSELGVVDARLRVGKGTYIRSIAEALGARLGVPTHLGALRRTAVGSWLVGVPGVVTGLVAAPLDPAAVGKPRARVGLANAGSDRDAVRAILQAALVAPETTLADPVARRLDEDPVVALLRQGRAVSHDALGELGGARGWVSTPGALIRVESGDGRYRPVRLIHRRPP